MNIATFAKIHAFLCKLDNDEDTSEVKDRERVNIMAFIATEYLR